MEVLLYLALLPCWVDADSPIWPPVDVNDVHNFGDMKRSITYELFMAANSNLKRIEEIDPAILHIDRQSYRDQVEYLRWVKACWDRLDDVKLDLGYASQGISVSHNGGPVANLSALRRLLGPLNYYRGIMPTVAMEVWP